MPSPSSASSSSTGPVAPCGACAAAAATQNNSHPCLAFQQEHPHPFHTILHHWGSDTPLPPPIVATSQRPSAQQEAWDRMSMLFNVIRDHARGTSLAA
ncbi:hypothetical protein SCLCIDRAFT_1207077 [Scleroderma citrinum Foug A]|uniref:Uncharacterized protein n=1 Tax=Scleroderma citrinum Foug A TaxID=1036808 RepID=A0A0C3EDX4_9AGAM|nr:hypothetical protein SCLCIDRAFT_1207077 [Scleroderma citrinum Foug A]